MTPLVERAKPHRFVLPVATIASAVLALFTTRAASESSLSLIDLAIVLLIAVCAMFPDTHLGTLAVLILGLNWLVTVDDVTTPWSIGAASAIALLHMSLAAASLGPPGSRWSKAVARRWVRRLITIAATSIFTWLLVAATDRLATAQAPTIVAAALLALALAGTWTLGLVEKTVEKQV